MSAGQLRDVISRIKCGVAQCGEYTFCWKETGGEHHLGFLVWATYTDLDIHSRETEIQSTRKWYVSQHATDTEIIQTCLACVLTSAEHRVRENFLVDGKRAYGPHVHIEAHLVAAKVEDRRKA